MSIHLQIPEPCHENWQNMQPNKDGRHCMACQKTVVDFSNMTDKEILDYISNAGGEICGRVDRIQLNRGLQDNNVRKRFSWIYIWNMVIVLFVFAGKTKAQGSVIRYQKTAKCTERQPGLTMSKPRTVNGIVQNAMTGEPVPFASVMLKGTEVGVSTDSAGKFLLEMPVMQAGTELEISSLGFETAIVSVSDPAEQTYNLSPAAKELDQVVVSTSLCYRHMSGGLSYVRVSTIYEKINRELGELLPKKDVIIYPNPIPAGNNIHAALQLKEKGEYHVDLVDAGGRIVWMQKVNISDTKYNLSIPTQRTWSAGIYWLRISGNHTKKIYNGKIVIQ